MVSKINIGPEDGPYVAINEEDGNLQLEDNSGNVVAEWDETNAQWDFANNTLANVDALDSNSVNTDQSTIGEDKEYPQGPAREFIDNLDGDKPTIQVDPSDPDAFDTIQGAIDSLPRIIRHEIFVEIADGDYDEDVVLSGFVGEASNADGNPTRVSIQGDTSDPSAVSINSVAALGCRGSLEVVELGGLTISGKSTPYIGEDAAAGVIGGSLHLNDVVFDGSAATVAESAIINKQGDIYLRGCDLGSASHTNLIRLKENTNVVVRGTTGTPDGGDVYVAPRTGPHRIRESDGSDIQNAPNGPVNASTGGFETTERIIGGVEIDTVAKPDGGGLSLRRTSVGTDSSITIFPSFHDPPRFWFYSDGDKVAEIDENGNLSIVGSITEDATL